MFKKLTSNRDPRDTLWNELQKEFGGYYDKATASGRGFVNRYPRPVFFVMIVLMLLSIGLSFTVFRNHEPTAKNRKAAKANPSPLSTGFGQVMQAGEALRETIILKQQVDSLIAKKQLTKADSATLEKALDKLQQLNNHLDRTK
jgi:hypothetical protein